MHRSQACADHLVSLLLLLVVMGCSEYRPTAPPEAQTRRENKTRSELNLRLIKPDWVFYREEFGAQDWKYGEPGFTAKRVQRDSKGGLVWEEDYYYSGKKFEIDEGTTWEMLVLRFDYKSQVVEFNYIGTDQAIVEAIANLNKSGGTNAEKASAADAILKRWGLSRL